MNYNEYFYDSIRFINRIISNDNDILEERICDLYQIENGEIDFLDKRTVQNTIRSSIKRINRCLEIYNDLVFSNEND